jgi:hypothetical protein
MNKGVEGSFLLGFLSNTSSMFLEAAQALLKLQHVSTPSTGMFNVHLL